MTCLTDICLSVRSERSDGLERGGSRGVALLRRARDRYVSVGGMVWLVGSRSTLAEKLTALRLAAFLKTAGCRIMEILLDRGVFDVDASSHVAF